MYRLESDKLSRTAIDPLLRALRSRGAARGIVVGGGEHLRAFEEAAARAGVVDRVRFTRYMAYEDLRDLYARMAVFLAPVHSESFGQVSVFAMGMGLPVVGYDAGALKEILGRSDTLAAPGNACELAEIIVRMLDNPRLAEEIGGRTGAVPNSGSPLRRW